MQRHVVPRLFHVATLVALLITVALTGYALAAFPIRIDALILCIAVLAAVSESYAPVVGGFSASLTFPLVMSALLMGGPLAGAVVASLSALRPDSFSSEKGLLTTAYNLAQHTSVAIVGGWVYVALGGTEVPFQSGDFPRVLLPLFVTAAVCAAGNILSTVAGVSILYRVNPRSLAKPMLGYAPSLLALAAVGYLMAQVMAINIFALPLFIFPLVVARQLYQSFVQLREAYTDTVRSLVNALETKDSYTHGHSERVAGYAVAIATRLGMDDDTVRRIEHAGLLHDLGKLRVRADLLRKPGALTDAERELICRHPADGAVMISKIPPLRDLAPAVMEHHERPDGRGYPNGESESCVEARILAVADCFDAMTTDRPYRSALTTQQAIEELRLNSGSQFDAAIAAAFIDHLLELPIGDPVAAEAPGQVAAEAMS